MIVPFYVAAIIANIVWVIVVLTIMLILDIFVIYLQIGSCSCCTKKEMENIVDEEIPDVLQQVTYQTNK